MLEISIVHPKKNEVNVWILPHICKKNFDIFKKI